MLLLIMQYFVHRSGSCLQSGVRRSSNQGLLLSVQAVNWTVLLLYHNRLSVFLRKVI